MDQFELDIAKKLNVHLDRQDELQDEVKEFFRDWFENVLDPVELANDPEGYLAELEEKAIAIFREKYLPVIYKDARKFGKSVHEKVEKVAGNG